MKFRDLLDANLLENGTFTLRIEDFNVVSCVREVIQLMDMNAAT